MVNQNCLPFTEMSINVIPPLQSNKTMWLGRFPEEFLFSLQQGLNHFSPDNSTP